MQVLFKKSLLHLWFNKGNITAEEPTAFQKIFVGETVNNPSKLSVRNWIQFYMQELKKLNYYGFVHYYPFEVSTIHITQRQFMAIHLRCQTKRTSKISYAA